MSLTTRQVPMGRPGGEVRRVMLDALRQEAPLPLRDWAAKTQVGIGAARQTASNLVRAQVVEIVGHAKAPHCTKWVALYGLKPEPEPGADSRHGHGWVDLARCIQGWAR